MFRKNVYLHIAAWAIRYRVPLAVRQVYRDYDGIFSSLCPRCHRHLVYEYVVYCPQCGQRLSWIFLDEAEEFPSFSAAEKSALERQAESKLPILLRWICNRRTNTLDKASPQIPLDAEDHFDNDGDDGFEFGDDCLVMNAKPDLLRLCADE